MDMQGRVEDGVLLVVLCGLKHDGDVILGVHDVGLLAEAKEL